MTETWALGQTGEELAADYLSKHGYHLQNDQKLTAGFSLS